MAVAVKGHSYDEVESVTNFLLNKTKYRPTVGIVCGSGLGGLVANVQEKDVYKYEDIPGFPVSTVQGHAGKLVFGTLSGKTVVCLQGRFHLYEGHGIYKCTFPVRVMASLGITSLIVTNAAGGINRSFNVGDIMIIKDHIAIPLMAGQHPLMGLNDDRFGPRFPSMTNAYDKDYRAKAMDIAKRLGYGEFLREGIYSMCSGPSYETQAELGMMSACGSDAAGMSTAPEVVVAKHMGLKVLGISLITNKCIMEYDTDEAPNHAEVLAVGKQRSDCVLNIVTAFVKETDP